MEDLCERFPLVAELILDKLDDQSLVNCKESSRELREFLDNEKLLFLRIIRKQNINFVEFHEAWKKILDRAQVEFVKQLAIGTKNFFNIDPSRQENQWHPLIIAANHGILSIC